MRSLLPSLLITLAACTAAPPPPESPPPVALAPRFEPAGEPGPGTLFLAADLSVPEAPRLLVFAQGLGDVFGFAFHLALEGAVPGEPALEPVLGTDAYSLSAPRGRAVAFGAARPGLEAGTVALAGPVRLASVRVTAAEAEAVIARLERAQVRDGRGELVPVRALGGTLNLGEAQ